MFSQSVKEHRRRSVLTQAALAEAAGVATGSVAALEAGSGSLATFLPLLDAMDLRIVGLPKGNHIGRQLREARERKGWTRTGSVPDGGD